MVTISLFLRILALVLFVLAAANISHPRVNFLALGLAAWLLSTMF